MIARRLYRWLLWLHPPSFRERFGEEMLWIFDQSFDGSERLYFLLDGLHSLFKQHLTRRPAAHDKVKLFQQAPSGSLNATRFLQASMLGVPFLLGFFLLLQQSVPLPVQPKTIEARRYIPFLCGESVPARQSTQSRNSRLAAASFPRSQR